MLLLYRQFVGHFTRRVVRGSCIILGAPLLWFGLAYWGPPRTIVNAQRAPSGSSEFAEWTRGHAAQWESELITIQVDDQRITRTRRQLGATLDQRALVQEVGTAKHTRFLAPEAVLLRQPISASWSVRIADDEIYDAIDTLRALVRVAPTPHVFGPAGNAVGGIEGRELDRESTVDTLRAAMRAGSVFVTLATERVPPPEPLVQAASSARFDVTLVERTARYGSGSARGHNIERAARELDGAVLPPGSVLSFNAMVGERRLDRGFAMGPEVGPGGTLTEGVGGGICQLAGELYRSALEAGLTIDEWHPHSRRVGYAPLGMDAAVSWGTKDLVIRNPTSAHLRLSTSAIRGRLRVSWEGAREAPPLEVEVRTVSGQRSNSSNPVVVQVERRWTQPGSQRQEEWRVTYPALPTENRL